MTKSSIETWLLWLRKSDWLRQAGAAHRSNAERTQDALKRQAEKRAKHRAYHERRKEREAASA